MKTERRHDLETNTLAKFLTVWTERLRPYVNAVAVGVVGLLVLFVIYSWVSGDWSSRSTEAWDVYNVAMEGRSPDMTELKQSAEEFSGTKMQEWADITWADGQLLSATRSYLLNRPAAEESLDRAASAYLTLLGSSTSNPRVVDRAHFGLARVYELRKDFDKAREQYMAVSGEFAELAKYRLEQLELPRTKEAIDWLASAEVPRAPQPTGPGMPGQRPDFSADPVDMPPDKPVDTDAALQEILRQFNNSGDASSDGADRYAAPEGGTDDAAGVNFDNFFDSEESKQDTQGVDTEKSDEPADSPSEDN